MYTSIITKECFNTQVEHCICSHYWHVCIKEAEIDYDELEDREVEEQKDCDANLNEYWPRCGRPISEPRMYTDYDWDAE